MRLTEFMIVIIAALMFLIPTMKKEGSDLEREAQEEVTAQEMMEEGESLTYTVSYTAKSPQEDKIADIIWMKKAAGVAQDAGVPYFNVVNQKIRKKFVERYNMELSTVEGVIQLDNDPMNAEFDAHEIENLILSDQ